jgi:hypothetical protein
MRKTTQLKNKQLRRRLVELSQLNKKDVSKTFDDYDDDEEVDMDEIMRELEDMMNSDEEDDYDNDIDVGNISKEELKELIRDVLSEMIN